MTLGEAIFYIIETAIVGFCFIMYFVNNNK